VQPHVKARTLKALSYGKSGEQRVWKLVTRTQAESPAHLRAFTSFLREAFKTSASSRSAPAPLRAS